MSEPQVRELRRFMFSGSIATAVDYALLNFFAIIVGLPVLVANSISAPFSSFVSYKLNKNVVFEDRIHGRRVTIALYVLILAFGILVIQNGIIHLLHNTVAQSIASYLRPVILAVGLGHHVSNETIALNISKIIGSLTGAVWNYLMLRRFVFVTQEEASDN